LNGKRYKYEYLNIEESDCFFKFKKENENYIFQFEGVVSPYFLNNIVYNNIDYIPISLYELSNIAQLFYRKFILKQWKKTELSFLRKDYASELGFKTTDASIINKSVERVLQELEKFGFLIYHKTKTKRIHDNKIYWIEVNKKQKDLDFSSEDLDYTQKDLDYTGKVIDFPVGNI